MGNKKVAVFAGMRRHSIIALIVVLCFAFVGCGQQDKSQFDESTNQKISFHGIGIHVPAEWKIPDVEFDENTMTFAEWPDTTELPIHCLALTFEEDTTLAEAMEEKELVVEIWEEQGTKLTDYVQTNVTIENMDAYRIEYDKEIEDVPIHCREIVLATNNGVVVIFFASTNTSGLKDFEEVVHSLYLLQP